MAYRFTTPPELVLAETNHPALEAYWQPYGKRPYLPAAAGEGLACLSEARAWAEFCEQEHRDVLVAAGSRKTVDTARLAAALAPHAPAVVAVPSEDPGAALAPAVFCEDDASGGAGLDSLLLVSADSPGPGLWRSARRPRGGARRGNVGPDGPECPGPRLRRPDGRRRLCPDGYAGPGGCPDGLRIPAPLGRRRTLSGRGAAAFGGVPGSGPGGPQCRRGTVFPFGRDPGAGGRRAAGLGPGSGPPGLPLPCGPGPFPDGREPRPGPDLRRPGPRHWQPVRRYA